jgi:tripartite-type tricarboxylate transporter receptor subunit TctC
LKIAAFLATAIVTLNISDATADNSYPSKPIRVIVPFAAGGTIDIASRVIGEHLAKEMGQPVVIDNRPGANGMIGTETVAKAEPDGHTILFVTASFAVNPTVYRKVPYDIMRDFAPITELGRGTGYIVVVPEMLPVASVRELVDKSKEAGVKWNFSSPGIGNTLHLAGEMFNVRTGARFAHVPYRGVAPAVNAVVAGEVQMAIMPPLAGLGHVQSGKVRALAFTGRVRTPELPNVPTMQEAGFSDLVMEGAWLGAFAPGATPRPVIERLQREIAKALTSPKVADTLRKGGYEPAGSTSKAFAAFVKDEVQRYGALVRELNIEPQ